MTMVGGVRSAPVYVDGVALWSVEQEPAGFDPLYWVRFLGDTLNMRVYESKIYDDYYRGEHRLFTGPSGAHVIYRRLLRESRSNWAELIVDAVNERLAVEGFRFTDGNGEADLQVWRSIWQRNGMDARSDEVHVESLIWGYAYCIAWPDADGNVEITPEHPTECICYSPPQDRRKVTMALKRWQDDWGGWNATLYTPFAIYKYETPSSGMGSLAPRAGWLPRMVPDEPWPLPNPFKVVPVIEFPNNPRLLTGGRSELANEHIAIIDRINETVFNRMLAAQFSAFRQKWVSGMEIPRDPETGAPVEPFRAAVDRLWMAESPDVKFGEFSEATLANYIAAAEADISHLASITRTPAYYLLPRGPMPSGEALKAAETGLVAKVKRRQRFFGEAWELLIRLSLLMEGDPRSTDTSCETIWAAPEAKSDAQTGDLLIKMAQIGTPAEVLWELSGFFSPQQIERMKGMQADEALRMQQLQPTVEPTPAKPPRTGLPEGVPVAGGPTA